MSETPESHPKPPPTTAEVCGVLGEMAAILDEHFARRDEHNTRREVVVEKLIRRLSMGIAMIGLVAVLLGAMLFKLINDIHGNMESMTTHMAHMRDYFFLVQNDMRTMTQHVRPMQQDLSAMRQDFHLLNQKMDSLTADMRQMTVHLDAMDDHTQSMANTIARMQYDTGHLRLGVQSMSRDTNTLSSPLRWFGGP